MPTTAVRTVCGYRAAGHPCEHALCPEEALAQPIPTAEPVSLHHPEHPLLQAMLRTRALQARAARYASRCYAEAVAAGEPDQPRSARREHAVRVGQAATRLAIVAQHRWVRACTDAAKARGWR